MNHGKGSSVGSRLPVVYFSRWVSLVAGVYLMLLSGSIYMFAVYSSDLKQIFGYSTEDINLVGTLANAGAWTSILSGVWLDFFGPRSTGIIGGVMNFTGYFLIYMAAKGHLASNNVVVVGLFAGIMGQGGSWVYIAALKANASNFPREDRGKVVGALVCFFGLSSGVLTQLYKGFYAPDVLDFLLFLAILLGSGPIVIGLLVNAVPTAFGPNEASRMNRIKFIYIIGIVLAVFIGASSIATGTTDVDSLPFAVAMLAVIGAFALVPITTGRPIFWRRTSDHASDDEANGLLKPSINATGDDSSGEAMTSEAGTNLWQTLKHVDFWLIFFIFFALIGAGITLVNNFAELVFSIVSVDHDKVYHREDVPDFKTINTLVSLFSSFNTLGRMGSGFLSDWMSVKWGPPARVTLLVVASVVMAGANIYFAFALVVPMLYPGVVFLGLAYGTTFCVMPTLMLEFFGVKYFATNFGVTGLAPALGSELLGTLLAGKLNDYFRKDGQFATSDSSGHLTTHCNNSYCYRYTFFITAFLCVLSVLVSLWLWKRRRDLAALESEKTKLYEEDGQVDP